MFGLTIDVDSVMSAGSRVLAASEVAAAAPHVAALAPAAADPVSVGVATALQSMATAIGAYTAAGAAVTSARGQLLVDSADTYAAQEANNAALLSSPGTGGKTTPPLPLVSPTITLPPLPPVVAPVIGPAPATGREIAALVHSGPGVAALCEGAQSMRSHASELRSVVNYLNSAASQVFSDWPSESGVRAAGRISELATWYEQHAQRAGAVARAIDSHVESFTRVKAGIPTPEEFAAVESRLLTAAAANSHPANMGRYAPVVAALQAQLAQMNAQAIAAYTGAYATESTGTNIAGDPLLPPPGGYVRPPAPEVGHSAEAKQAALSVGAGPGPNAGPGLPPSLAGGGPSVEQPIYPLDPNGAGPGSGVLHETAPIAYSTSGAGPGPNAGPGLPPSLAGGGPSVEQPIYPLDPNGAGPGSGVLHETAPISYREV